MKTTAEIIAAFSKGKKRFSISDKQYNWLSDVARKEKISRYVCDAFCFDIDDKLWQIKPKYVATRAYGGFVGKKQIPGYNVTLRRWVEFSNGHIRIYDDDQLYQAEADAKEHGFTFDIICNPEL